MMCVFHSSPQSPASLLVPHRCYFFLIPTIVLYKPELMFSLVLCHFLHLPLFTPSHSNLVVPPFLDYDFGDIFPVLQSLPSADWEGGTLVNPSLYHGHYTFYGYAYCMLGTSVCY